MARLNLGTKKLVRQKNLAAVTLLWSDFLYSINWWFQVACRLLEMYARKQSLKARYVMNFYSQRAIMYKLVYASDVNCMEEIRMNRQMFIKLCSMLQNIGGLRETKNMLVEEQVAMFLHVLAHHSKNRVIKNRFERSGESVSRHVNNVLTAIIRIQGELLKKPEPIPENSTDERWKWFKNCLGALDGTYIRVRVPIEDQPRYRSRKGEIATNVLAVCSTDMQFIYILPGWEGSAADGRILRDAVRRNNVLKVPRGYYYLVDAGYTNCEGFLAPYRGQRYHLNDWREGHQPTTPHEFFNMKYSAARNVIERCFGLLKLRWAILRSPSFYPIKIQNRIIMACCLLHNFIRKEMPIDPLEEGLDMNGVPNEAHGDPITTIEASNEWSAWRENLAVHMFNEWRASREGR